MLTRSMGLQGSQGSHTFSDVADDIWYHDVLTAAVDAGLIPQSENFRPTEPITRGQALIFLRRAGAEDWVYDALDVVSRKQKEDGFYAEDGLTRGAAAWLVAMLVDAEALPELTFKPIEEVQPEPEPAPAPPQPVYVPQRQPEPEPEPEEPWVIPADPLAPAVPETSEDPMVQEPVPEEIIP